MNSLFNLILATEPTYIGENVCSDENVVQAIRMVGYILYVAKVFIPFLIIIFGTFDVYKAVTGGDEKSLSSSFKALGIRCVIGIAVFLVPTIIDVVFNAIGEYNDIKSDLYVCETCLLKPFSCETGVPEDTNPFDEDLFTDPDNSNNDYITSPDNSDNDYFGEFDNSDNDYFNDSDDAVIISP